MGSLCPCNVLSGNARTLKIKGGINKEIKKKKKVIHLLDEGYANLLS